jgi:hypothetical protein
VIADNALGLHGEHTHYSDLDVEKLNAIPKSAMHRNVDIPIIEADSAGFVKAYFITPGKSLILFLGPFVARDLLEHRDCIWLSLRTIG